jgi:hypothetical protein
MSPAGDLGANISAVGNSAFVEAMRAIATTGVAPADQKASMGCSIKWKDA